MHPHPELDVDVDRRFAASGGGARPAGLWSPAQVPDSAGSRGVVRAGGLLLAAVGVADATRAADVGAPRSWWILAVVIGVAGAAIAAGAREGDRRLVSLLALLGVISTVGAAWVTDGDPWVVTWHTLALLVWLGTTAPAFDVAVWGVAQAAALSLVLAARGADDAVVPGVVACGVGVVAGLAVCLASSARRSVVSRRLSGMSSLLRAADVLAALQHPDQAARVVASLARDVLAADAAFVAVRPTRGPDAPAVVAQVDWPGYDERATGLGDPAALRAATRAVRTDEVVRVAGDEIYGDDGPFDHITAVPLRGTDGVIGVVCVGHRTVEGHEPDPGALLPEELIPIVAAAFARQAGLAFERVRSLQRVVDASLRDPLTGLANRRSVEAVLGQLGAGDAVVLIDLDNFKAVNDSVGHAGGDRLLVEFASFLRLMVRAGDTVGRWGGEEFVVVLVGAGDHAGLFLERLLDTWRERRPAATFSAGVSLASPFTPVEQVLAEADAALYRAKRAGRDRVCFDERSVAPGIDPAPA